MLAIGVFAVRAVIVKIPEIILNVFRFIDKY
jgi:hypothetical protein